MENFEEILKHVTKPGRYLGNEWNVIKKNFSRARVKVALCFPDIYEIGMSHLGFRIIYGLLNSRTDTLCERSFCPWPDFSEILQKKKLPLFSLESKKPLNLFDIVAFTLAYELNYTNILEILRLSNIPLKSEDRNSKHPLIIGGGPCTLNPEPLADFFDLFVIGEGEEVIMELIDVFKRTKKEGMKDKKKLLLELSKIEGIYVPSLRKELPKTVNKRIVHNLDKAFYPEKYIVPYISIVHDRVIVEIMRGCIHRCKFCQANACYRPVRIRSKEKILNLIKNSCRNSGYEDFSLMSLSSGDYPDIIPVIEELSNMDMPKQEGVSVSLSSLRVEDILSELPQLIKKIKKTGLTFAPEAGSERLRNVISKKIDIKKLLDAVKAAQTEGWRRVKLYFMIGLPTEDYSDLDGILELLEEIKKITKSGPFDIALSVSPFIPKPHTPFQWEEMNSIHQLLEKQQYLKSRVSSRKIKMKFHKPQLSFIEAIFSRGDRKLGKVLLSAFKNGAKFDSWDEFFNFYIWMEAFSKEGIDPEFYTKKRNFDETLPWDHINVGVPKEWLIEQAGT